MYNNNAHFYNFFHKSDGNQSSKATFIKKVLFEKSAQELLDIGTGPGDFALELAKSGVFITCIEPSAGGRRTICRTSTPLPTP